MTCCGSPHHEAVLCMAVSLPFLVQASDKEVDCTPCSKKKMKVSKQQWWSPVRVMPSVGAFHLAAATSDLTVSVHKFAAAQPSVQGTAAHVWSGGKQAKGGAHRCAWLWPMSSIRKAAACIPAVQGQPAATSRKSLQYICNVRTTPSCIGQLHRETQLELGLLGVPSLSQACQ